MWQNQINAQFRGTTWERMHMAANKHLAANQLVLAGSPSSSAGF